MGLMDGIDGIGDGHSYSVMQAAPGRQHGVGGGKAAAAPVAAAGATAAGATAVHIRWERFFNRLRLYGSSEKLDAIQASIQTYLQQRKQQSITKAIPLPAQVYKHLLQQGKEALEALQQQSAADSIGLDVMGRQLQVKGRSEAVAAAEAAALKLLAGCEADAGGAGSSTGRHKNGQDMQQDSSPECPVCRCDPDQPYSLATCGHTYCTTCLRALLDSAARNNTFPVHCCEGACSQPISLADIGQLLPASQLAGVFSGAFRAFVQDRHEEWGCCPTPDCPQVYRKGELMFQCDCCLAAWCTSCLVPYHLGQTCAEYQAGQHGEAEFDAWKRAHARPCPKCKTAIEKSEGCNHMTCSRCKAHFCWLCGQEFASGNQTYDHLVKAHGGIFNYPQ